MHPLAPACGRPWPRDSEKLVFVCLAAIDGIDVITQRLNVTLTPSSLSRTVTIHKLCACLYTAVSAHVTQRTQYINNRRQLREIALTKYRRLSVF